MWTFIVPNLHELTDFKVQMNKNNVNNCKSNNIARSQQRRHITLFGRLLQILVASKAKLWPKCLACIVRSGKEELLGIYDRGDYGTVGATVRRGWSKIARTTTV